MTTKGMLIPAKRIIELASLCDSKSRRLGVDWSLFLYHISIGLLLSIGFLLRFVHG